MKDPIVPSLRPSILTLLRRPAQSWWYHRDLRSRGQHTEARRREHESMRRNIAEIPAAIAAGHPLVISANAATWTFDHAPEAGFASVASTNGYGQAFVDIWLAFGGTVVLTGISLHRALFLDGKVLYPTVNPTFGGDITWGEWLSYIRADNIFPVYDSWTEYHGEAS